MLPRPVPQISIQFIAHTGCRMHFFPQSKLYSYGVLFLMAMTKANQRHWESGLVESLPTRQRERLSARP